MEHVITVLLLQVAVLNIVLSASSNFTCPVGTLRKLRSKIFCADDKQYHCIYDTLKHVYIETCIQARQIGEGKNSVLSGNLDVRECDHSFYSPYAVWSNDGHRCYFMKSLCNEEGQVTVCNGTSTTDRSCRCDYTRGYDYVTTPKDPCKCSPSTEDCSCYIRVCSKHEKLNQDYECENSPKDQYTCNAIAKQEYTEVSRVKDNPSREICYDCNRNDTNETVHDHVTLPLWFVKITLFMILPVCIGLLLRTTLSCYCEREILDILGKQKLKDVDKSSIRENLISVEEEREIMDIPGKQKLKEVDKLSKRENSISVEEEREIMDIPGKQKLKEVDKLSKRENSISVEEEREILDIPGKQKLKEVDKLSKRENSISVEEEREIMDIPGKQKLKEVDKLSKRENSISVEEEREIMDIPGKQKLKEVDKLSKRENSISVEEEREILDIPGKQKLKEVDKLSKREHSISVEEGTNIKYGDMQVVSYFEKIKQIYEMKEALETDNGNRFHGKFIILRGIPGSGKTQAAHYYCQEEGHKYSFVAKLNASNSHRLLETLKELNYHIRAEETLRELTTEFACSNIKTFLNDNIPATSKSLLLVDNASCNNEIIDDLKYVLSLVSDVKNLDMIMTTYHSSFEKEYKSKTIEFNGMGKEEYTNLLKRNENGSPLEISDESIEELVTQIGKIPIVINSARQYLITTGQSVREYLETFKSLKPIEKLAALHSEGNISYNKDIGDSLRVPLTDLKHNIMHNYNDSILWAVIMLLPLLCHESVSTTVLEACYFHLQEKKDMNKKFVIDSLIMECERYSLCYFNKTPKSKFEFSGKSFGDTLEMSRGKNTIRYLTFHEVTMAALVLVDDEKEFKVDIDGRLRFLLKMFCFEIDIDARTDITLQRNVLFVSHAKHLLRQIDESNVVESDEILYYKSYLHCAIGSTFLFEKTDIESAHVHLIQSRSICLTIVGDCSYFTKDACIGQQIKRETVKHVKKPTPENIKSVAELVLKKQFDENFVQDFVLGRRRNLNDIRAIKSTTGLKLKLSNGHYMRLVEYTTLIKDNYAIPMKVLGRMLLGELLLRILVNNGRVFNEFLFSSKKFLSKDRDKLQEACNTEFQIANEFCKLLQQQYPDYLLFVCLENNRTGRMLMRYSAKSIEIGQICSDIDFYKNMIHKPFDRCFNFGVLNMSRCFNDRHICMCRGILIRYLQWKFEKEDDESKRSDILEEGLREVELLIQKLEEMEKEGQHESWLIFPLLNIQCAKFLILSKERKDFKNAYKLFQKGIAFEESREVFWTRYIHEGYYGLLLCLRKLHRHDDAKQLIKTTEEKYPRIKTAILQIKHFEYELWR